MWRDYVRKFLDFFDSEVLGVFIDDTDVNPEITEDILHTVRIFFSHPRIVTVIAGHLRSMRQSLMQIEMADLRESLSSLGSADAATAVEWRRFARRQIEEYLEKVLPRFNRFYLSISCERSFPSNDSEPKHGGKGNTIESGERKNCPRKGRAPDDSSDDSKYCIRDNFDTFCMDRLYAYLSSYHKARTKRLRENRLPIEAVPLAERYDLDHFISWWLFWLYYGENLYPQSIRQSSMLECYTMCDMKSKLLSDHLPEEHRTSA